MRPTTCDVAHRQDTASSKVTVWTGRKARWKVCGRHLAQVSLILLSPSPTTVQR